MKLVLISDTHGKHGQITSFPEGDIFIHAGDFSAHGYPLEIERFSEWLGKLPYKHKIVVAGNRDTYFQRYPSVAQELLTSCIYLQDNTTVIEGIRFYGTPWTNKFRNWAFMASETALWNKYNRIVKTTDILISHGPPFGIMDQVEKKNQGSRSLLRRLEQLNLKCHIFGHIHENRGVIRKGGTTFINCSTLNGQYEFWDKNNPFVVAEIG